MKKTCRVLGWLCMMLVISVASGYAQKSSASRLPDGLYVVVTENEQTKEGHPNLRTITYNKLFHEEDISPETLIKIDISDFVPLVLAQAPKEEEQQEGKQRLMLHLTPEASEKLKSFSTKYVQRSVAIVMDGEALSVHRIREPLTSGMLQISWCSKYACEQLQSRLVQNVNH